jgi:hypothetical protein
MALSRTNKAIQLLAKMTGTQEQTRIEIGKLFDYEFVRVHLRWLLWELAKEAINDSRNA